MNPDAQRNYEDCIAGKHPNLKDVGVIRREYVYTVPAIGICERCGKEVELAGFTNTCDCGADYNMWGSLLADRSCWGWDTGESVQDILMADADYRNGHDFSED
jgi:hypothetical protein